MSGGRRRATADRADPRLILKRVRDGILTLAAVVGVATFLVMAVCAVLQIRPLVFMSGSMSPTIDAGALAFAQRTPVDELKRGDIVSVVTDDASRVTHRVVAIDRTGAAPALRLKGDANPVEDRNPYIVPSADRVLFSVPYIGRGVAFISSSEGLFLLGVGVAVLLFYAFRPGLRRRGARALALGIIPLAITSALANPPAPTRAYFTDTGTITADVSTGTVPGHANPTCTNILVNARLTWTQVNASYQYVWELRRDNNGTVEASGTVGAGTPQGGTVTLDINPLMSNANINYNVVIRARVGTSGWLSNPTSTPVHRDSFLVIGNAFRCGHT